MLLTFLPINTGVLPDQWFLGNAQTLQPCPNSDGWWSCEWVPTPYSAASVSTSSIIHQIRLDYMDFTWAWHTMSTGSRTHVLRQYFNLITPWEQKQLWYIGGVAIFSKVSHNCGGVSGGKQVARWSALEFCFGICVRRLDSLENACVKWR
jgi:hypothetical protein